MEEHVAAEDVAQQFEKAILLLLNWAESREISSKFIGVEAMEESFERIRLLRVDEVAEILAISKAHAYQLISRGELGSVRLGRSVRVRKEDINTLIANMSE